MATQLEVIKKFMASLDTTTLSGAAALDEAIRACSTFKNFKELRNAIIRDCKKAKSGDDFLKTYCGIDYSNGDTGLITGLETGVSTTEINDADCVPESGKLNTKFKGNSFTVDGLKVTLADGKTFKDLNTSEKFVWRGLYTWWVKSALDLITKSYGDNFSFGDNSSATTRNMYIVFNNEDNNTPAYTSGWYNSDTGEITGIFMGINMHYWDSLKDNLEEANTGFDRTLAHEMTHAVMYANMLYDPVFNSLPGFVIEGLAELTVGTKNSWSDYIKALAADPSQFESGLNVNKISPVENFMYGGGFVFFRYLARQAGDLTLTNETSSTVQTFRGNDNIINYVENASVNTGAGDDYVAGWGQKKVTISSGTGKDFINNWTKQASINTAEGDDTVYNASVSANTYISTGAGNDSINNLSSKVTLSGDAGHDFIHSEAAQVSISGGKGNDSLWNGGKFDDNWHDGGNKVTMNGGAGNDYIYNAGSKVVINAGDGNDSVNTSGEKINVDLGKGDDYIYLYADSKVVTIKGGAGKDSIHSGSDKVKISGDAGNDYIMLYANATNNTVDGGTGNDSIMSYSTSGVLYKYANGDGKDTITGFSATDTLSIADVSFSTKASGSDLRVTVGKGSVLLKEAKKLSSNIVLSASNSAKSSLTLSSTVKNIDASSRTKAIQITGNKLANSIAGGSKNDILSGGKGNDTLRGGKGNDKLWGDKGADTFIYASGDGKDIIYGFDNNDMLLITGTFKASYNKSNDAIYFKVGSTKNAITLKNFDATTFNINGDAYHISGKKLVTK